MNQPHRRGELTLVERSRMTMTSSLNTSDPRPAPHGRGSAIEPPNRFLKTHAVPDYADFENDPEFLGELRRVPTEFLDDASQSIVSENDSPDVPFRYSVNPYPGLRADQHRDRW